MGVHWLLLTVTFALGKKQITLRGDLSLTKLEVSLKTLTKSWNEDDQGF